jgi:DNA mismatch endonuclease, patch repair protein
VDRFTPEQRSRIMAAIHDRNTAPEMLVRSMLHRLGYRYRLHDKRLPGTPDLVFPSRKCVIFVHGCFWHGHSCRRAHLPASNVAFWTEKIEKNKQRDQREYRQLRARGWRILAVWQCEMKDHDFLQKKLTDFLEEANRNEQKGCAECPTD